MGVCSCDDFIGMTAMLIKGETGCVETIDASELKGPLGEPHALGIPIVKGHK